jgi:pimeloyl-ACP methyl ester carboxylesterase
MQTQFLSRPGGAIAYDDRGAGPLVLCVPGLGDLRAEYRFLADRLLAAGHRVVTMDLRGHGESSAGWGDYSKAAIGSDIVALLRHLDAGPATVVGASYAAGAALFAAAEAPELVAGLVLIGPFVRAHGSASKRRRDRAMYSLLFARPWGVALWKSYFPRFFPSRKPDDFAAYLRTLAANLRQPGRLRALRAMMTTTQADAETVIAQVRKPTLVVMGTRDPDFPSPEQEARWIAERLTGANRMIDGAGHYPHVEYPEQTGPVIVDFLRAMPSEEASHGR